MMEELDSSTGYLGNPNLKRTRVPISWTPELLEEFLKCQEDPIYFAEKYIKIVHVDRGLIPIVLYDYQKEIIVAFNENRRTAVVTSRQAGKTTTAAALILHFILFNEHKTVALLANKGDASREILDRIKLAYEALPKWMQSGIVTWNKGSIELENGCKVIAAATSSSAIRGKSIALLYIDECSQGLTLVTILNKLTGEEQQIKIEDLYKFNSFDNYLIKTDSGFKEFSTVSCVEAATVLLKFDDGSGLGCTYGHRIKTADGSYTEARDLKVGDKTSTGLTLLSKEDNGRHKVYDVVEVDGGTYLTGNVVSHNCAFVNNWDEFFASVFPTISSGNTTKILLTSTPNGLNHFYQICEGAKEGTNGYAFVEVSWQRIPGRDEKWRHETLATMNFDLEKFSQEYECVSGDTLINIRNKVTGEVRTVTIGELYNEKTYM